MSKLATESLYYINLLMLDQSKVILQCYNITWVSGSHTLGFHGKIKFKNEIKSRVARL